MPDGWEVSNSLDPLVEDSAGDLDGDGLSNLEEFTRSTDPQDHDTDDDGYSDGEEVDKGTNTLDPNDYPKSRLPEFFWQSAISVVGSIAGGIVGITFFFIKRKLKKKTEKIGAKE